MGHSLMTTTPFVSSSDDETAQPQVVIPRPPPPTRYAGVTFTELTFKLAEILVTESQNEPRRIGGFLSQDHVEEISLNAEEFSITAREGQWTKYHKTRVRQTTKLSTIRAVKLILEEFCQKWEIAAKLPAERIVPDT